MKSFTLKGMERTVVIQPKNFQLYQLKNKAIFLLLLNKATILSYNQPCTQNAGCDSTKGLSCSFYNQTLYYCLCANLYYWTGSTCTPQIMGNPLTSCTSTSQCRSDLGLYCLTNCVCYSTFYWDTISLRCCMYNFVL